MPSKANAIASAPMPTYRSRLLQYAATVYVPMSVHLHADVALEVEENQQHHRRDRDQEHGRAARGGGRSKATVATDVSAYAQAVGSRKSLPEPPEIEST